MSIMSVHRPTIQLTVEQWPTNNSNSEMIAPFWMHSQPLVVSGVVPMVEMEVLVMQCVVCAVGNYAVVEEEMLLEVASLVQTLNTDPSLSNASIPEQVLLNQNMTSNHQEKRVTLCTRLSSHLLARTDAGVASLQLV